MARQTSSRVRLPDPPAAYDPAYMRKLVAGIETQIQRATTPVASGFVVQNAAGTTARTLDVSTATATQVREFLGELAAALISNNRLGGTVE